jgi:Glycosyltransferase 61
MGFEVLGKEQSIDFLSSYLIATRPGDQIILPAITDFIDAGKHVFSDTDAISESAYVWEYQSDDRKARLLRCGALFTEGKVLCLDWRGNRRLISDIVPLQPRVVQEVDFVIAPWSHYLDGVRFGGYYDYLVLVAGKLCRIKESLATDVFERSVVAYPLFNTTYEQDLLTLIGFDADRIYDSRLTDLRFKTGFLGNSGHWFYPNFEDLMALKRQIEPKLPAAADASNRIYISRSGRRRIVNEGELIAMLEKYGIQIIEDQPRTVAEQVSIYRNASFIIGPHGGSFTNILWCRPGTHLVELFSSNYVPDFFLYMAQRLELNYSAHYFGPESENRFSQLEEDIRVSIPELERRLNALFSEKSTA